MFISRRRRTVFQAAPTLPAPTFMRVSSVSTTQINVFFTASGTYNIYVEKSVDESSWSVVGTAVAPGGTSKAVTGLTRGTKYFFRIRHELAGEYSAYYSGPYYYTWPMGLAARQFIGKILSPLESYAAYQNTEGLYLDNFDVEITASSIDLFNFDNFIYCSPTAANYADPNGMAYDVTVNNSETISGGTYSTDGLVFNYDGYISLDTIVPGAGFATPYQFMMLACVKDIYGASAAGYAKREMIAGRQDAGFSEYIELFMEDASGDYVVVTDSDTAAFSYDAVTSVPASAILGAGAGFFDIDAGNIWAQSKQTSVVGLGNAASGNWYSTPWPMYVGATNVDGTYPDFFGKFTLQQFIMQGFYADDFSRDAICTALSNWNAALGR